MSKITVYGIKNCDSVRKAKKWLDAEGVEYQFHDFKTQGLEKANFDAWVAQNDLFTVVNKRSATWKKLSNHQQTAITNGDGFNEIQNNLSLIKRPVVEKSGKYVFGFDPEKIRQIL